MDALITIDRARGSFAEGEDPAAGERVVTVTTSGAAWQGRSGPKRKNWRP